MVWGLLVAASLAGLGPEAALGGIERAAASMGAAPTDAVSASSLEVPASTLVAPLRLRGAPGWGAGGSREGDRWPDLSGAGGGFLDPGSSSGVDSGVACVAGALIPGLGHAILGQYLPRGLAFTSAFAATLIGSIAALTHAQDSPALRGQLLFAGLVLMLAADVIYLWSVIDALMISSNPRRERKGPEVHLGRD